MNISLAIERDTQGAPIGVKPRASGYTAKIINQVRHICCDGFAQFSDQHCVFDIDISCRAALLVTVRIVQNQAHIGTSPLDTDVGGRLGQSRCAEN